MCVDDAFSAHFLSNHKLIIHTSLALELSNNLSIGINRCGYMNDNMEALTAHEAACDKPLKVKLRKLKVIVTIKNSAGTSNQKLSHMPAKDTAEEPPAKLLKEKSNDYPKSKAKVLLREVPNKPLKEKPKYPRKVPPKKGAKKTSTNKPTRPALTKIPRKDSPKLLTKGSSEVQPKGLTSTVGATTGKRSSTNADKASKALGNGAKRKGKKRQRTGVS